MRVCLSGDAGILSIFRNKQQFECYNHVPEDISEECTGIIIDRKLFADDRELVDIAANIASLINVVIIIRDFDDMEDKHLIERLVPVGVNAYIPGSRLTYEAAEKLFDNYPGQFNPEECWGKSKGAKKNEDTVKKAKAANTVTGRQIKRELKNITIAVCGARHGVGVTTTAILIARYLKVIDESSRIALTNLDSSEDLSRVSLDGIDVYPQGVIPDILACDYNFIVIDTGVIQYDLVNGEIEGVTRKKLQVAYHEYHRAIIKIAVCQYQPWQIPETLMMMGKWEAEQELRERVGYKFIFTLTGKDTVKALAGEHKNLSIYHMPAVMDINDDNEEVYKTIAYLLGDVIYSGEDIEARIKKDLKNRKERYFIDIALKAAIALVVAGVAYYLFKNLNGIVDWLWGQIT